MWILWIVSLLGYIASFLFMTLAIASGLYYLSELVEEHTVIAKRFITRMVYFIMVVMVLLCAVDRFPVLHTLVGVASHAVYLGNMRRFPFIKWSDPLFLVSCVLVAFNHWIWMAWFDRMQKDAYSRMASYYDKPDLPSFMQVASFFGICVWIIPFSLFVSLTAGDNVLPTMGNEDFTGTGSGATRSGGTKRQGMVKAIVDSVQGAIGNAWTMASSATGRRESPL